MRGGGSFSPAVFSFLRKDKDRYCLLVHLDRIPCRNYTVYTFLKQKTGNGIKGGEKRCQKSECV